MLTITNSNSKPEKIYHNDLLFRISNELLRIRELDDILETSIKETIFVMRAFSVSIALLDESKKKLIIKKIVRADGTNEPTSVKEFKIGQGVAGLAAKRRSIVVLAEAGKSKIFIHKNSKNKNSSQVSSPLITNGELIGVLSISYHTPKTLNKAEKEFLTILSTIIAGSIQNSFLMEAEKELARAKNNLIATATHELRTPLTATRGYLEMLISGDAGEMQDKQKTYLKSAYSSTERLVNLVEDLLSALRISENRLQLKLSNFSIKDSVNDSIESLRTKAQKKEIEINAELRNLSVFGDKEKTKHIIENLLDNAIKYTKNKGRIIVNAKDSADKVTVSISDNGIGIAKKFHNKIFDQFVRVENALSVRAGGTGLGLYITKGLVEKQNGQIWIESEPKIGSTFYFTIPKNNIKEKDAK